MKNEEEITILWNNAFNSTSNIKYMICIGNIEAM